MGKGPPGWADHAAHGSLFFLIVGSLRVVFNPSEIYRIRTKSEGLGKGRGMRKTSPEGAPLLSVPVPAHVFNRTPERAMGLTRIRCSRNYENTRWRQAQT